MLPDIHQPQSDAAVDGRSDVRVDQVQLRIVDLRLIRSHRSFQLIRRRLLGVHLLPRHCSRLVKQALEALVIQLRVFQLGLVAEKICLRLVESHLEGPGIDDRQQVSLVDVLAFLEIDLRQLSVHPALHADRVGSGHVAQSLEVHRHIAPLSRGHADRHHGLGGCPRRSRLGACAAADQERGCRGEGKNCKKRFSG